MELPPNELGIFTRDRYQAAYEKKTIENHERALANVSQD